ncbi:MAG: hypothetical protein V3U35_08630 [Candidatus Neomarinimicrobiota bacterium]
MSNGRLAAARAAWNRLWTSAQAWWHALPRQTNILILDWLILLAVIVLVAVIYVPKGIWAEEDAYREESRRRLEIIWDAEEFYHTIRGNYTLDGEHLFRLVSLAHDSLIADSTFIGDQVILVDDVPFRVSLPLFLDRQIDTTFSVGRLLRREVSDTTYSVRLWNAERADHDTVFISGSTALAGVQTDNTFRSVLDTAYSTRSEVYVDYDWNRFRLEPGLLVEPVTGEPFEIHYDSTRAELTIASPIRDSYVESRYLFFKFEARNHGQIVAGDPSWRRN